MSGTLRVSEAVAGALRCPRCRAQLHPADGGFVCSASACGQAYPVVDGRPVLINEANSAFAIDDFTSGHSTTYHRQQAVERFLSAVIPTLDKNFVASRNYGRLAALFATDAKSRLLVVGCGDMGKGMEAITAHPGLELVNTDVYFGRSTHVVCDGHDLPFADGFFDGAIVQAVLEHVADPARCVAEIHRVLKPQAVVYAETPFMQQVHGGPYDFTRFTPLGHRRLFRAFAEIDSGAVAGPGTALAWSWQYFLLSFVRSRFARSAMKAVARLSGFWLKYFDHWLLARPGAHDAASACYFLGRKTDRVLADRELVKLYRGAGATLVGH
ncbi:MAG TPA: methyltransferase domain-containing protein [Casimicrobiaceae bacterium]|nr:methyltransferase domain-containing protein [Casimicrobiaceae bacterium]